MKLHDLKPAIGATTAPKRLGRGVGSGLGKTSGKGHKGAKARSGGGKRAGFEGGQIPLMRRLPKRGFTNKFRTELVAVNVDRLDVFEDGMTVTPVELIQYGIIKNVQDGVKILGNGELTVSLNVDVDKVSSAAEQKIVAAGGSIK